MGDPNLRTGGSTELTIWYFLSSSECYIFPAWSNSNSTIKLQDFDNLPDVQCNKKKFLNAKIPEIWVETPREKECSDACRYDVKKHISACKKAVYVLWFQKKGALREILWQVNDIPGKSLRYDSIRSSHRQIQIGVVRLFVGLDEEINVALWCFSKWTSLVLPIQKADGVIVNYLPHWAFLNDCHLFETCSNERSLP